MHMQLVLSYLVMIKTARQRTTGTIPNAVSFLMAHSKLMFLTCRSEQQR
jgi:hypothetical protein